MFEELFKKYYTISYQNHHILTKKYMKLNFFYAININIDIDTLSKSVCLGGTAPRSAGAHSCHLRVQT
jgi:hypothetical protein